MNIEFTDDLDIANTTISIGSTETWPVSNLIGLARNESILSIPQELPLENVCNNDVVLYPDEMVTFETLPSGLLTLAPGATATTDGEFLSVVANYTNSNCILEKTFTEGRITFQVKRGPLLLGFHTIADGTGWQIWSGDGNIVYLGHLNAAGNTGLALVTTTMPGTAGELINIEVETGPNVQGGPFTFRMWVASSPRPTSGIPLRAYGADYATGSYPRNSGKIRIVGVGSTPVVIKSITIRDGRHCRAYAQASFSGRWLYRWEDGQPVMATTRGGASMRFTVDSPEVFATFVRSLSSSANAVVAVYVDNVFARLVEITYSGEHELVTGLTAGPHNIEVVVSGMSQSDNRWRWGAGVQVSAIRASGTVEPWPNNLPSMLWHGDSLIEGSAGYTGFATVALNSCSDRTYPLLASKALGFCPITNGFGGLGLTVGGSGGWPVFSSSSNGYMHDRLVTGENPQYVFLSFGTNDGGASSATMRNAVVAAINSQKAAYPSARVVVVAPSSGAHKLANTQAAGDTLVKVIDLSGILVTGDTTDGTHPTPAGHVKLANSFVSQFNSLVW